VALDFCYKPTGSSAQPTGPVLANLGATQGLSAGDVTRYFELDDPTGGLGTSYDVTAFLAGGNSCGGLGAQTFSVTVYGGHYATVVVSGALSLTAPPTIKAFEDDLSSRPGETGIRFIHADGDTAYATVEVGVLGASNIFDALFTAVTYPNSSAGQPDVDANGYLAHGPVTTQLQARVNSVTSTPAVDSAHGSAVNQARTFFLYDTGAGGGLGGGSASKLISCLDDGAVASSGDVFASCE